MSRSWASAFLERFAAFLEEDETMADKLFYPRRWHAQARELKETEPVDECEGCGSRPAQVPCPKCAQLDALFVDLYEPRVIEVNPNAVYCKVCGFEASICECEDTDHA